ncbi:hypothetical protein IGI37_001994 [Enterococcus sp. AZ194]|uniref:hypothetical protein n=1 Tax=Enterococcus sp. AZ194 TaxID=2774629 RepID=UPI003F23641F
MNHVIKYKKSILISLGILLVIIIISAYFYYHGRTSKQNLQNLDAGITQEKVIEYVGNPKDKTIDNNEILNWAPESLVKNEDKYAPLEMYVYNYEDGEARLFFSKGFLIYKELLRLNMSDDEYFDMYKLK